MNLATTKLLFTNTIQKEFRSKTLFFLFVVTFIGIITVNAFLQFLDKEITTQTGSIVVGNHSLNFFFWIINSWCVFLSSFFGVNTVRSDKENNVLGQLLSFPIKRYEYLLARIFGTSFIVFSYYLISVMVAVISFSISTGGNVWNWGILPALFFVGLTILAVTIFSILASEFLPKLMALLSIVILNLIIFFSNIYINQTAWEDIVSHLNIFKVLGIAFHWGFPHLSTLGTIINSFVMGTNFEGSILLELTHFVGMTFVWGYILSLIFSKRDF